MDKYDFVVAFDSQLEVKLLDAEAKKKVKIVGKLMNTQFNDNNWAIEKNELFNIASQVKNSVVKMQHSEDDWEIIGKGVSGFSDGETIIYEDDILDPKAVEKFESGSWSTETMGISPSIGFKEVICSICGQDARICNHFRGQVYDNQVCKYTAKGATLMEQSLTSRPAYKSVGAGTIDLVMLGASIDDKKRADFENKKMEAKVMTEEPKTEPHVKVEDASIKLIAEKDEKIKGLEASLTGAEASKKELEAAKVDNDKKFADLSVELTAIKEKLKTFVIASRTSELKKRISDEKIIASYLGKDMSDEDFAKELSTIDAVKASVTTNANAGSVQADKTMTEAEKAKERYDKLGAEMFGSYFKSLSGGGN